MDVQLSAAARRPDRRLAYAWHLEISKSESCPCGQNERLRTCNRCAFHGGEWGKATGHALAVGLHKGSADSGEGSEDGKYERKLHGARGRWTQSTWLGRKA